MGNVNLFFKSVLLLVIKLKMSTLICLLASLQNERDTPALEALNQTCCTIHFMFLTPRRNPDL